MVHKKRIVTQMPADSAYELVRTMLELDCLENQIAAYIQTEGDFGRAVSTDQQSLVYNSLNELRKVLMGVPLLKSAARRARESVSDAIDAMVCRTSVCNNMHHNPVLFHLSMLEHAVSLAQRACGIAVPAPLPSPPKGPRRARPAQAKAKPKAPKLVEESPSSSKTKKSPRVLSAAGLTIRQIKMPKGWGMPKNKGRKAR